jgi:predicted N-acetyltransferase YhbS
MKLNQRKKFGVHRSTPCKTQNRRVFRALRGTICCRGTVGVGRRRGARVGRAVWAAASRHGLRRAFGPMPAARNPDQRSYRTNAAAWKAPRCAAPAAGRSRHSHHLRARARRRAQNRRIVLSVPPPRWQSDRVLHTDPESGVADINSSRTLTYRPFTERDLPAAQRLSEAFNWPHRIDDWRFVLQLGSGVVAEDETGVVGTALGWPFGASHASLGMVIVSPERQGRGLGRELLARFVDGFGARTVFLHATPAGEPLYAKFGFQPIGTINQHQGAAFQPPLISLPPGERLRPLGTNDGPRLAALASRAAGYPRDAVIGALLEVANGIALDRDGELLGFALFRRFGRGHVIGPVVAPDPLRAQALISHWLALNAGIFVRLDVPGDSGLSDWLQGLGLPRVDTVVAMARGDAPARDPALRTFAIVNQALG